MAEIWGLHQTDFSPAPKVTSISDIQTRPQKWHLLHLRTSVLRRLAPFGLFGETKQNHVGGIRNLLLNHERISTPPPARFFPRVHEPFNQVVSQPAPRRAWRKGRPPRVSLPEAQQRSDGRRKERHAAETLTFAGAFAAGPGAWALLVQKWLILMRPDLKLQLVSRKGTKNTAFNNSSQALP